MIDSNLLAKEIKSSPEETLETFLFQGRRFNGNRPGISPPFEGEWSVWQGAAGQWTHQGNYCHAIDFIIVDEAGSPHMGDGYHPQDYHCFGKPVLSPVSGRVISLANTIPDNPVGRVDTENNWGNHVILQTEAGFFVELSHLCQGSIQARKGDWVTQGDLLGHCGNSGYSPQPHLHIQVQENGLLGASTLPFCFSGFIQASEYRINSLPCAGTLIKPVSPKKANDFAKPIFWTTAYILKYSRGHRKSRTWHSPLKWTRTEKPILIQAGAGSFSMRTRLDFSFMRSLGMIPFSDACLKHCQAIPWYWNPEPSGKIRFPQVF